jgi:hypothetical protein
VATRPGTQFGGGGSRYWEGETTGYGRRLLNARLTSHGPPRWGGLGHGPSWPGPLSKNGLNHKALSSTNVRRPPRSPPPRSPRSSGWKSPAHPRRGFSLRRARLPINSEESEQFRSFPRTYRRDWQHSHKARCPNSNRRTRWTRSPNSRLRRGPSRFFSAWRSKSPRTGSDLERPIVRLGGSVVK